ncbi:DeoR/GlpR family DNA-binding transcription regulator [Mycoplasmopsis agassizii]|uniref:DeoR/GlpR transcriptional regulator n=1 Tax=Mycoplasmopsis agassizii TaxID=33922 RepID=A0ABX4H4V6_9BACT|nr:DeoR/GlpR family DNA-binding transcription regulator [Mycoplasmopsis agassizii]PAF54917.1 DeoR/GlpR transcriptional regulator [Mycoplasmopsis agassizii]SMC17157.1 transcriptional regulator, DeoR family [Mycoplasmopsis agassizii]
MVAKIDRIDAIRALFREKRRLTFEEIYKKFGEYSAMTIRRDLNNMIRLNELQKVSLGYQVYNLTESAEQEIINSEKKRKIGNKLDELIKDGDVIYFSPGTTNLVVVGQLTKRVRVYTNDYSVFKAADSNKKIEQAVLIGGFDYSRNNVFVGETTIKTIQLMRFDYAVYGVVGIARNGDLYNNHMEEAMIEKTVALVADKMVIVADDSKMQKQGHFIFHTLAQSDYFITNNKNHLNLKRIDNLTIL